MIKKHLLPPILAGLSHIIPLLIVSGVMIIIRPLFSLDQQTELMTPIIEFLWMLIFPIFSAFLMFSISDRPAIVPGLVIGFLIYHFDLGYVSLFIFSFLGAYIILGIKIIASKTSLSIKSIFSNFIMPLITIGISIPLIYFWHLLIQAFFIDITNFELPYIVIVILAVIFSAMMSYDLGGPVNKIAFLIGVLSLKYNEPSILMAAIMAGGMISPLGIAFASLFSSKYFSEDEKRLAKNNYLNGLLFMTEGALPFLNQEIKKKRATFMIFSGLAGLIVALFKTKTTFPHGGILLVPFMDQWVGFLVAIGVSSILLAITYRILFLKNRKNL